LPSYFTDKQGYRRPAPAIGFYRKDGVIHPITQSGVHEHTPNRKLTEYNPRRAEQNKRHEPRPISSISRRKYHEWHNEFERKKMNGQHPKALPIGAFDSYYRSRKAAFEATGGTATTFDDQFDKIDVAQAVDSWSDLDSELKSNDIYASREDVADLRRKAREQQREEREIERSYREYAREQRANAA
jgi:hypothetical protein